MGRSWETLWCSDLRPRLTSVQTKIEFSSLCHAVIHCCYCDMVSCRSGQDDAYWLLKSLDETLFSGQTLIMTIGNQNDILNQPIWIKWCKVTWCSVAQVLYFCIVFIYFCSSIFCDWTLKKTWLDFHSTTFWGWILLFIPLHFYFISIVTDYSVLTWFDWPDCFGQDIKWDSRCLPSQGKILNSKELEGLSQCPGSNLKGRILHKENFQKRHTTAFFRCP